MLPQPHQRQANIPGHPSLSQYAFAPAQRGASLPLSPPAANALSGYSPALTPLVLSPEVQSGPSSTMPAHGIPKEGDVQIAASSTTSPQIFRLEAVTNGVTHQLPCQSGRPAWIRVGRDVGPPEFWERLVPCEATRLSISREHFEIREVTESPTGFVLRNLSSKGTFINGRFVQKDCPIEPGDTLMIGFDQSSESLQAVRDPNAPRRAALQLYFIVPAVGADCSTFSVSLSCVLVTGRSLQELSYLPDFARCLSSRSTGSKSALLRVGRAMQLPMWWESLLRDEHLVNDISREHFRIRDEGGRPVLVNMSQAQTIIVNGEYVEQERSLCQEDLISILSRHDMQAIVTFCFTALDVATGKVLPLGLAGLAVPVSKPTQKWRSRDEPGTAIAHAPRSSGPDPLLEQTAIAPALRSSGTDPLLEQTCTVATQSISDTPPLQFLLKCVCAYGQDAMQLKVLARGALECLRPAPDAVSLKVGRAVQPDAFWAALLPSETARNTVSRECFEISSTMVNGRLSFLFKNLSSAGTLVNGKRVYKNVVLQPGDIFGIGSVQPQAGQTECKPAVELELALRSGERGQASAGHGTPQAAQPPLKSELLTQLLPVSKNDCSQRPPANRSSPPMAGGAAHDMLHAVLPLSKPSMNGGSSTPTAPGLPASVHDGSRRPPGNFPSTPAAGGTARGMLAAVLPSSLDDCGVGSALPTAGGTAQGMLNAVLPPSVPDFGVVSSPLTAGGTAQGMLTAVLPPSVDDCGVGLSPPTAGGTARGRLNAVLPPSMKDYGVDTTLPPAPVPNQISRGTPSPVQKPLDIDRLISDETITSRRPCGQEPPTRCQPGQSLTPLLDDSLSPDQWRKHSPRQASSPSHQSAPTYQRQASRHVTGQRLAPLVDDSFSPEQWQMLGPASSFDESLPTDFNQRAAAEPMVSFGDLMCAAASEDRSPQSHQFELVLAFEPPPPAVLASQSSANATEVLNTADYPENTVFVNIYDFGKDDFGKMINDAVMVGGVFHAGIEVYDNEWSFGATEEPITGIWRTLPRMEIGHTYRATVPLGHTNLSSAQVMELVQRLGDEWQGMGYDLIRRNCLNFCNILCDELGVQGIPPWVDRAPRAATAVLGANDFIAARLFGCTGRSK